MSPSFVASVEAVVKATIYLLGWAIHFHPIGILFLASPPLASSESEVEGAESLAFASRHAGLVRELA